MKWLAVALLAVLSACFRTLEPRVQLADAELAAIQRWDDSEWAATLSAHVDEQGRVDYARVAQDREALDRYVALLARIGPRTRPDLFGSSEAALAYYLNAYNALVVFSVIERPGLRSVADDKNSFFYFTRLRLDGQTISLYDLENYVIRKGFREPRAHFALNCASAGCPRLPRAPFTGASLEQELDYATQRFLHEERNVARDGECVVLSALFGWFEEDFAPSALAWIRERAPDLELPADAPVRFRPWDWSLNGSR